MGDNEMLCAMQPRKIRLRETTSGSLNQRMCLTHRTSVASMDRERMGRLIRTGLIIDISVVTGGVTELAMDVANQYSSAHYV